MTVSIGEMVGIAQTDVATVDSVLELAIELQEAVVHAAGTPPPIEASPEAIKKIVDSVKVIEVEAKDAGIYGDEAVEVATTVVACLQAGIHYPDLRRGTQLEVMSAQRPERVRRTTGSLALGMFGPNMRIA